MTGAVAIGLICRALRAGAPHPSVAAGTRGHRPPGRCRLRNLASISGAVAVLHAHSRRLDLHPRMHLMPGASLDARSRRWRTKAGYLFSHKALAKVFRGKLLALLKQDRLNTPGQSPGKWVVDCKSVGNGEKAFVYRCRSSGGALRPRRTGDEIRYRQRRGPCKPVPLRGRRAHRRHGPTRPENAGKPTVDHEIDRTRTEP